MNRLPVAQCKGKELDKVPASKLDKTCKYYASIKYDGNFVRCGKIDGKVFMNTRNKPFWCPNVASALETIPLDTFAFDCEYIGESEGKKGDRRYASLTPYIANYRNNVDGDLKGKLVVFDFIQPFDTFNFSTRLYMMKDILLSNLFVQEIFMLPEFKLLSFDDCLHYANEVIADGWEGVMIKSEHNIYKQGKRINDIIKLKNRYTLDVRCVAITRGSGKYDGKIGALVCDYKGAVFNVGSGLTDADRSRPAMDFIGEIIEIEYEQIMDNKPIQPTFVCIRKDK